jgi:hypothetical protein
MGTYTSLDDVTAQLSNGRGWRSDFYKTNTSAYVAGNAYELASQVGNPANTNAYSGSALTATIPTEATGWGIYHGGNVSTATKQVLNAQCSFTGTTAAPGVAVLVDVALYYPGIDLKSTSSQGLTNTNTLTRWTDGKGVRAFICVTVRSGNPSAKPVMSVFNFRDDADNDSNLAVTPSFTTGGTAIPDVGKIVHAGPESGLTGMFLPWNAGDSGMKRVTTFQLSTAYATATTVTGAIVLCRPLLSVPLVAPGVPGERSFIYHAPARTIIPDGACLVWLYQANAATAAASVFQGHLDVGWSAA